MFVVCCWLIVFGSCCLLFVDCWVSFSVCCLLFVMGCLLYVAYHLSSVLGCLLLFGVCVVFFCVVRVCLLFVD